MWIIAVICTPVRLYMYWKSLKKPPGLLEETVARWCFAICTYQWFTENQVKYVVKVGPAIEDLSVFSGSAELVLELGECLLNGKKLSCKWTWEFFFTFCTLQYAPFYFHGQSCCVKLRNFFMNLFLAFANKHGKWRWAYSTFTWVGFITCFPLAHEASDDSSSMENFSILSCCLFLIYPF